MHENYLKPLISVCIPVFNCVDYVESAIRSVLNQSYDNFEIIIVDNCSSDGTADLINSLKLLDKRIILFKNKSNIGLAENFNRCIKYSNGEYIKFLCADDLLDTDCIYEMVEVLISDKSIKLVASSRKIINEHDSNIGSKKFSRRTSRFNGEAVISRCFFGGNYIGEPTAVMFRKSEVTRGFSENFPQLMDIDFWFQLLERGDFYNIAKPLCSIRVHSQQMSNTNLRSGRLLLDNVLLFNVYSNKTYLQSNFFSRFKYQILMTHRVWISKEFIDKKFKNQILNSHGSKLYFWLIPFSVFFLSIFRRLRLVIFKALHYFKRSMNLR